MTNNKFTIEEEAIAELLGRQFYKSEEAALFEIIKNSYDAGASYCLVIIEETLIKIIDDGHGMNNDDIQNNWLHVGKSNKGYMNEQNNRVYAGAKGVGRFALARLGDNVKVYSKKNNYDGVCWETNWNDSLFSTEISLINTGTIIEIRNLRDKWNDKIVKKLCDFLERTYRANDMDIVIRFNNEDRKIKNIFEDLNIGENYSAEININYSKEDSKLALNVISKEFLKEVKDLVPSIDIENYIENIDLSKEFKEDAAMGILNGVGSFKANFYFAITRPTQKIVEEFKYRQANYDFPNTGIVLYRNAFSLSNLDGSTDWLEITARARKSPAAATHKTGSWRVRSNQITGYIMIDKLENPNIKDLSNRQGIEENDYSIMLKKIVDLALKRFESYRQNIIRKMKNSEPENLNIEKDNVIFKNFVQNPKAVKTMTEDDVFKLAKIVEEIKTDAEIQLKARKDSEEQHKYEVRILNVLATQGLRASAIAHELQNKRNFLDKFYDTVVKSLKKYNYWEELNSPEKTRVAHKNVPKLLEDLNDINQRLIAFIDVILNKIKKEKFKTNVKSLDTHINDILQIWKDEYNWINFNLNIQKSEGMEDVKISKDALEVIFDNLILNSVQHNSRRNQIDISIDVLFKHGSLYFVYKDNGIGLDTKYKDQPERILEVHETSRTEGHGLGMWIINNTIQMYNGEVSGINGIDGFEITFNIRGVN